MNDISVMSAVFMFVLAWYGLTVIGRELFKRYENMRIVWCPEVRSFSYIETETDGSVVYVKSCLLWPEYGRCNGHCIS